MSDSIYTNKPWLKQYPASTPEFIPPLSFNSLPDMITSASLEFKDSIAYTICLPNGFEASLTYGEVETLSNNLAAFFRFELKLDKGDRVALQMPNCLTYPIAIFAVLKAGLTLVNLNPLYTENEIEYTLKDSGAKAIIIIDMFAYKLEKILTKSSVKKVITCSISDFFSFPFKQVISLKQKYVDKTIVPIPFPFIKIQQALKISKDLKGIDSSLWLSSSQNNKKNSENSWLNLKDLACLQYTGGTTGKIKGAELTHENILSNISQVKEFAKLNVEKGREIVITALPLYHIFSFTINCLFFYSMGAKNILIPSPRPINNLKKPFEKFQFTWITGVNTLFHALTNENWFIHNPPKNLKIAVAGGMPLLSATAQKWNSLVGANAVEGYGLTETSPAVTFNPLSGKIKDGSIGIPVSSTEIKLIDLNGKEVPLGEPGELCIKGPQIMRGYWQNPEETKQVFKDDWLLTGDIAIMDEEGYFKIIDRKKDMILISGFNVYPNEIEDCLQKLPQILECAVIGIPDNIQGETVKAFIVKKDPSLTEEQIYSHCREFLTSYKIPKIIEFISELPKSPVGKILKRELKK